MVTGVPTNRRISDDYQQRIKRRAESGLAQLWDLLDQVRDPELPVLSIWDLGVLRDLEQRDGRVVVTVTPTYSGCPAMETIHADIRRVLNDAGFDRVEVRTRLAPAWSSAWLSSQGSDQLREYGIAPPGDGNTDGPTGAGQVACPRCGSNDSRPVSEFGSTACKALFQCGDCLELFDYFKKI